MENNFIRVTRFCKILPFGLLIKAPGKFWGERVAQKVPTFWATFDFKNDIFTLNSSFKAWLVLSFFLVQKWLDVAALYFQIDL
jgi:hypothetical protein